MSLSKAPVFSDGGTATLPIFDPHTLHQIKKAILEDFEHHDFFPKQGTPLTDEVIPRAKRKLRKYGLVGGVWDKSPTNFYAICSKLRDERLLNDMIGGDRFALWVWCSSPLEAQNTIIFNMVTNATKRGIVKDWLTSGSPRNKAWLQNPSQKVPKGVRAQMVFDILKFKSVIKGASPVLKWRDVVSFAGPPLKPWAQYVGHCLSSMG